MFLLRQSDNIEASFNPRSIYVEERKMIETTGSCKCGLVQYEIKAEKINATNCHCKKCKKLSGSAFSALAVVGRDDFTFVKGEELLTVYQVSEQMKKHFCSTCGTPMLHQHELYNTRALIPLGTLDDPSIVTPSFNIFCESKLPWIMDIAELPSFDQLPVKV